ncbi:MAG: membrane protein insertion efficiency factor YidD, partial [Pseudobdellovibrionaceae bacterium]
MSEGLFLLVRAYRNSLSIYLGGACRFTPSCSCYAEECLKNHDPLRAVILICGRLLKCRPGGPYGYDP